MSLVHELEQFVNHSFQKLPMSFEKPRVLSDNVHDVRGNHGLVVLAALHLCQTEEILDDGYQEALLGFLVHGARDRSDRPAESVAVGPRPFRTIHLFGELLRHDVFGIDDVQMGEINKAFARSFIELDGVTFFDKLANDFALVIFHDEHLRVVYVLESVHKPGKQWILLLPPRASPFDQS